MFAKIYGYVKKYLPVVILVLVVLLIIRLIQDSELQKTGDEQADPAATELEPLPFPEDPDARPAYSPSRTGADSPTAAGTEVTATGDGPSQIDIDRDVKALQRQMEAMRRDLERMRAETARKSPSPEEPGPAAAGDQSAATRESTGQGDGLSPPPAAEPPDSLKKDAPASTDPEVNALQARIREMESEISLLRSRVGAPSPPPTAPGGGLQPRTPLRETEVAPSPASPPEEETEKRRPDFSPGYQPGRKRYPQTAPERREAYPPPAYAERSARRYDPYYGQPPVLKDPVVVKARKVYLNQPIKLFDDQVLVNLSELERNKAVFDLTLPSMDYLRWEEMGVGDRRILYYNNETYFFDIVGIGFNWATLSVSRKM